jgi:hypothetical protein
VREVRQGGNEMKKTQPKKEQMRSNIPPYQQRVIDEKKELDERGDKLEQFILSDLFKSLPGAERVRLEKQLGIMGEYSEVLGERIAAFKL